MAAKRVLVVGGGVAGLSAALDLAAAGVNVDIVEKSDFLGGHAVQFFCKATEQCVKCGACIVEEKLAAALNSPRIGIYTSGRIRRVVSADGFSVEIRQKPAYISPEKCTNCGACREICPAVGAVIQGFSGRQHPFYAIASKHCLYFKDRSCRACVDGCPERAIDLDVSETDFSIAADAVILATGFSPFDPINKPYGYGVFKNVVTSLELERIVKRTGSVQRPSDGRIPERLAYIQCVGSRDATLNHLWCSQICCASAMRTADVIRQRHPETETTLFYIDIQSCGRNFPAFYDAICDHTRMIRSIPGDIYEADGDRLKVVYWDTPGGKEAESVFDMVVLSVGITPGDSLKNLLEMFHVTPDTSGFAPGAGRNGLFFAGTVTGPMGIAEAVASGGEAALRAVEHLDSK